MNTVSCLIRSRLTGRIAARDQAAFFPAFWGERPFCFACSPFTYLFHVVILPPCLPKATRPRPTHSRHAPGDRRSGVRGNRGVFGGTWGHAVRYRAYHHGRVYGVSNTGQPWSGRNHDPADPHRFLGDAAFWLGLRMVLAVKIAAFVTCLQNHFHFFPAFGLGCLLFGTVHIPRPIFAVAGGQRLVKREQLRRIFQILFQSSQCNRPRADSAGKRFVPSLCPWRPA